MIPNSSRCAWQTWCQLCLPGQCVLWTYIITLPASSCLLWMVLVIYRGGPGPSFIRTRKCMSARLCADSSVKSSHMESMDKVLYGAHARLPRRAHADGQQPRLSSKAWACAADSHLLQNHFVSSRNTQQLKAQIIPTPLKTMAEEVNSIYMLPPVCIPENQQQSHPDHRTCCHVVQHFNNDELDQSQMMKCKNGGIDTRRVFRCSVSQSFMINSE